MKFLFSTFVAALMFQSQVVFSHDSSADVAPIDHLFKKYSEIYGTKFIFDPRVRAKVIMVGVDQEYLTQANLMDILRIYNFTAYEQDEIVYVLPQPAADHLSQELGNLWGE